jgi:hypothetical protein
MEILVKEIYFAKELVNQSKDAKRKLDVDEYGNWIQCYKFWVPDPNIDYEFEEQIDKLINYLESHTTDSMEYEECETRARLTREKKLGAENTILTYEVFKSEFPQSSPLKRQFIWEMDEFTIYYFIKRGYILPPEEFGDLNECVKYWENNQNWDLGRYYLSLHDIKCKLEEDDESIEMVFPHDWDSHIVKLELKSEPEPYDPYDD